MILTLLDSGFFYSLNACLSISSFEIRRGGQTLRTALCDSHPTVSYSSFISFYLISSPRGVYIYNII